jgi:flagellin
MMTMNISAARTQDIGIGGRASLTATGHSGSQGALAKQLNAGDLIINGVQVGASNAIDDSLSATPHEVATLTFSAAIAQSSTLIVDGVTFTGTATSTGATAARDEFVAHYNQQGAANFIAIADGTVGVRLTAKNPGNVTDIVYDRTAGAASGNMTAGDKPTIVIAQGGGDKSSSAIAKVAAINAVSSQSGVTATVGRTNVSGSEQSSPANLTGTVTINGIETVSFSTTTDAGVSRTNVVNAINLISAQTGVRAVDTGDLKKGVELIADDGRNITLALKTLTTAATGLGSPNVYTGSYQLTSTSGAPITLTSSSSGTIANAGVAVGTFQANVSTVTSVARTAISVAPSNANAGVLNAGTMRINGIAIDAAVSASDTASDVTATGSTKAASAIAIAAAINAKSSLTGVTAKAEPNTIVGTAFTGTATVKTLFLNNVTISLAATDITVNAIAAKINAATGQTGVVASDNGRGMTLTAADGRNISVGFQHASTTDTGSVNIGINSTSAASSTTSTAIVTAALAMTTYGNVTLNSDVAFTLEGGSDGNTNFEKLGFKTGTIGGANNGIKIAAIDVGTQTGAQLAITALDAAMKAVSMNQAQLGAYQNRLESAISNLTEGSTNMNASRSRVLDTDYAKESTNLAKAQIITQAATAMLAQANQSAQSVLALLK